MRLIRTLILLKCIVTVFGDPPQDNGPPEGNGPPEDNGPPEKAKVHQTIPHRIVKKPTLPFADETATRDYMSYYLQDCLYEYWKTGSDVYHGTNGYTAMFGGSGYSFNKSTVVDMDGQKMNGFERWRAKAVVSHNLASMSAKPYDIVILDWNPYEVFVKYKLNIKASVGPSAWLNRSRPIQSFMRKTYFNDSSGIVKYLWTNSTSQAMGIVAGNIIETTRAVAEILGYLGDDDSDYGGKYIANPIQFIFIGVFCVLTIVSCSLGSGKVVNY
eukprot:326473_1